MESLIAFREDQNSLQSKLFSQDDIVKMNLLNHVRVVCTHVSCTDTLIWNGKIQTHYRLAMMNANVGTTKLIYHKRIKNPAMFSNFQYLKQKFCFFLFRFANYNLFPPGKSQVNILHNVSSRWFNNFNVILNSFPSQLTVTVVKD